VSQRILHIIDSLGHSGAAHQLLVLANGLTKRGFDVHVTALDRGGPLAAEFAESQIEANVIGRRSAIDPIALLRLRRHIASVRPDVIHTWSADAALYDHVALVVRSWGRASGAPRAKPHLVVGQYRIDRGAPGWQMLTRRRIAQHADRLVTNSPAVRDWCVSNGLPADKFTIIPSGVAPSRPSDVSRDELLRELKLPHDARLIGVVGRLVPEKRVRDLIWAADLLRVLHDNLRVLIIGDGPLRAQLERYARLASDLEHIQFLGERDDVWRIMPHLDVLWNGSENVSQSVAILEAMAAGVPVIASDVPVNRELVVEGETGYLIPIGSRAGRAARARHTHRIFTDKKLAARLAASSRKRISEQYYTGQMVSYFVHLYSKGFGGR
jgi:glycosyltransferase involved in cell wall biosynthesis